MINFLWPLLIILLSPVYLKRYGIRWFHLTAGIIGLWGASLIITGGGLRFNLNYLTGYMFAITAAFIWANYSLFMKRHQPFPDSLVSGFCVSADILALILFFMTDNDIPAPLSSRVWLFVMLLGFDPTGLLLSPGIWR